MKYEIMINILFTLLSKDIVSATRLAQKYEVTTRTIYRYIDSLSLAGVPIETVRGADGGFRIRPSFKLTAGFLTEEEYNGALNAVNAINSEISDPVLERVIEKLKSVKRGNSAISLKSGNLIIDAGPWLNTDGYKQKLSEMAYSADKQEVLEIKYFDRNGEISNRQIEPHTLVFKQGVWYVYAFCRTRQDFRFFKIARIGEIKTVKETFTKRETGESLPFDTWFISENTKEIEFLVDKTVISDVEEWLGVENVESKDDGYHIKVSLPIEKSLIMKILSFGSGIKVISPKSLKDEIKTTALNLAKLYE